MPASLPRLPGSPWHRKLMNDRFPVSEEKEADAQVTQKKSLYLPVVLTLIGGTEPCELHQCIHRTLRNWKNKIWFLQNIFPLFLYTRESILYPLSFFARHSKYEGIERLKENHKWRTITTATSRPLSSLQHRSKPSNVAWSAAANDAIIRYSIIS